MDMPTPDVTSFDMPTSNSKERFGYHPYMVTRDGFVNFVKPFDNIIYTFAGIRNGPIHQHENPARRPFVC